MQELIIIYKFPINMLSTSPRHINSQFGFTLVELIITIAIIGILAAIAIPRYNTYVGQVQASRIVAELGELRLTVEECLQNGKTVIGRGQKECDPRASASNLIVGSSQVGVVLPNNMGVAQISNPLLLTTSVTATVSTKVNPKLAGKKIEWLRASEGSWSCSSNIDSVYLPQSCIHDASL